jgi:hypothetical protein
VRIPPPNANLSVAWNNGTPSSATETVDRPKEK